MPLQGINLNHLAALDALLVERNVHRAARRMGVTQSAMSHTLRGLRESFSDPLLVRVGNEMVLTPLAEELEDRLRAGIAALEAVASGRAAFDPSSIEDEFTLATHDGTAVPLAPSIYRRLGDAAPRARLHIAFVDPESLEMDLRSGAVDAAVVAPLIPLSGLETETLPTLSSEPVVILRRNHPRVGERITLDELCEIPHAALSLGGVQSASYLDTLLEKHGKTRTLKVRVAYLSALAETIETSDLLAVVPRQGAEQFFCKRWEIRAVEAPIVLPEIPLMLCWHQRFTADPAQQFFRDLVRGAAREQQ